MSPRTGRPKAISPKQNDVKVRLDDATHENLLKYCEKNNITKAEAIRHGIHLLLQKNEKKVTRTSENPSSHTPTQED